MAKMFYTLEEVAEKLGKSTDDVRQMAAEGQLQQFRDRDKLMFKRDQVDALAESSGGSAAGGSAAGASATGGGAPGESGPLELAETGESDAVNLADSSPGAGGPAASGSQPAASDKSGTDTGVSVFDSGEIDTADPMAQTQVTQNVGDEEELALESVGSGSGLLDLTHESDDTSLGAELLDEIYPGGDSGADESKLGTGVGSSGVFESEIGMETGAGETGSAAAPAIEEVAAEPVTEPAAPAVGTPIEFDQDDPTMGGFGAGLMLGAMITLVILLLVTVTTLAGGRSAVTTWATESMTSLLIWTVGLLAVCFVFGIVGAVVGKAASR